MLREGGIGRGWKVSKIAALFVQTDGCYFGRDDIIPYDINNDARLYSGPYPVIAHPPCQRWGKMWFGQPAYVARTGIRKKKGDDNGCFKSALLSAREYGGVIEHPWGSHAWPHFDITVPPKEGGWIKADDYGGYTCCVEQGRYGHYARKPTLLLVYGVSCDDLPELDWGVGKHRIPQWAIDKYGIQYCKKAGELAFKGGGTDSKDRIATPLPFMEILISIAVKAKVAINVIKDKE
jgi:hypothetical protein